MARTSVLTGGTNSFQTSAEDLNSVATDFLNTGVVGTVANSGGIAPMTGGLSVNAQGTPNLTVAVGTGIAYVNATPVGAAAQTLRVKIDAQNVSIASNPGPGTSYIWLYVSVSASLAANPDVNGSTVGTVVSSTSTSSTTDNGTPPAYGVPIAVITNVASATSITNGNITDKRTQAGMTIASAVTGTNGWQGTGLSFAYGANNGTKEFTMTVAGDQTGVFNPGDKLQVARTTTPPTQAMSFTAASSQFASKASPSGITFTNAFTCEAWVYLNSYTGNSQSIISRYLGGTGGFILYITGAGQPVIYCEGAAGANRNATSPQALPLKRWMHIAGVLTPSTGTYAIYLNGALIPTSNTGAGTALVQAGNLQIGSYSSTNYFDGYIAEARVWSAAQSQASIQANMTINCVGTETNLVALYQGNGVWTDGTANANTLTANAGATFIASNPYHATEYGVVTKASYSNPTTTLTVFTGTDYVIPNQTLGAVSYSHMRSPVGFPASIAKWEVTVLVRSQFVQSSPTISTWYNPAGINISVPTGAWKLGYQAQVEGFKAGTAISKAMTLSTANNTQSDSDLTTVDEMEAPTGTLQHEVPLSRNKNIDLTTQTPYYVNFSTATTGMTEIGFAADASMIRAECGFL